MSAENQSGIVAVAGVLASMFLLAAPSVLLVMFSVVLRRIYYRAAWGPVGKHRYPAPDQHEPEPTGARPVDVPASPRPERIVAAVTTRDVRLAYAFAGFVYAAFAVGALLAHVHFSLLEAKIGLAYASLAPSLLIVMWSMHLGVRRTLWMFLAYAALGVLLTFGVATRSSPRIMFGVALFVLLSICPLLPLFARSIRPFVYLLLPLVVLMFGVGILVDLTHPAIIENAPKTVRESPWLVVLGLTNVVAGFFLGRLVLRQRWPVRVIALAVALAGVVVLNQTASGHVPPALAIVAAFGAFFLQILICGALFGLFKLLQDRRVLTGELLHIHFAWAVLTVYFEVWAVLQPEFRKTLWSFVLALVLSTIALHLLLFLVRRRRLPDATKRVLLLRTFGGPDERQDLLDQLGDTWRRIGAVDVIAGIDVGSGAMQPSMLRAFLLHLTHQQFFSDEDDVAKRFGKPPSKIEGDARYPVNPVYCTELAWKSVFQRLDKIADAVLMDVRGFTSDNRGVVWELETLFEDVDLRRIVLLTDSSTNRKDLETVLEGRKVAKLDFERHTDEERRAIFDLLLDAAYA